MRAFDPAVWVTRFEQAGGVVALRGSDLWTGVVRARPDFGRPARVIEDELNEHPEWEELLFDFLQGKGGRSR